MKKILFVIFTILCMGNIVAQTSNRNKLIGQLTQRAIIQNKKLDLKKAALVVAEAAKVDTLTAEAALYYTIYDLMYPEVNTLYSEVSDDDLIYFCQFLNSDIYKKLENEDINTTTGVYIAMDMYTYMITTATGEPYKSEIPKIEDKEYDKLANSYIEGLGISNIMNDLINTASSEIYKKATTPEEKQFINKTITHLQKTFPLYYKNALYSMITKEELKIAADVYSRPSISSISKKAVDWGISFIRKITSQNAENLDNKATSLALAMANPNDTTNAKNMYNEYVNYIRNGKSTIKKSKKINIDISQYQIKTVKDSLSMLIFDKIMLANNRNKIRQIDNGDKIKTLLIGNNLNTEVANYYVLLSEIKNKFSTLSTEELNEIIDFLNSDIYQIITSNNIDTYVNTQIATDVLGYMLAKTKKKNYKTTLKPLNDSEFDKLATEFIEITNATSNFDNIENILLNSGATKKINVLEENSILYLLPATNFIKNNLHLYYKSALYKYVTKEQLQKTVDFHKQYMLDFYKAIKNTHSATQREQIKGFIDLAYDTQDSTGARTLCLEYLNKLQSLTYDINNTSITIIDTLYIKSNTYIGETLNNQPNGKGTLIDNNGIKYVGNFQDGKRHGLITTHFTNGDSITEVWAGDKKLKAQNTSTKEFATRYKKLPIGYGYYYDGSCKKEGFFIDGKLNGNGVKDNSITDNIVEQGEFVDDILVKGERIYKGKNQSVTTKGEYHGNIFKGEKTKITYFDGEKNKEYKKGLQIDEKLEGYGIYEYSTKSYTKKSEGFFVTDELYGEGTETKTWSEKNQKQIYKGEFWNGSYHGTGNYEYSKGNYYSESYNGAFFKGEKHGIGTYHQKWNNDINELEKQINLGTTVYTLDESKYIGEFANNQYNGKGTLTCNWINWSGNKVDTYTGDFIDGKYNGKGVLVETFSEDYLFYKQTSDGTFNDSKLDGEFIYTETIENKSLTYKNSIFTFSRFDLQFTAVGKKTLEINIQGNLKNGKLDGYAKITTSAGEYYDGIFKDGEFWEGKARIQKWDDTLDATFKNGVICRGTIKYAKGVKPDINEGVLLDFRSKLNGYAKITTSAGEYYDGIFKDGNFWEGKDHYYWLNGDVLENVIYKDGCIFSGTEKNKEGKIIRNIREGKSFIKVRKKK